MFATVIKELEGQVKHLDEEIKRAEAERVSALKRMERAEREVAEQYTKREEIQNALNLLKINEGIVNRAGHDLPPIPSPDTQGVAAAAPSSGTMAAANKYPPLQGLQGVHPPPPYHPPLNRLDAIRVRKMQHELDAMVGQVVRGDMGPRGDF